MMRRSSRSLFVARNRALLQASSRAVGKGATNPNIVGSSTAPQDVDPAGQLPLQFGKHERESAMFSHAAGAWDAMRKVGQANPIEKNIERFEDRYQTAGTGTEHEQQAPSLWERAKEAVHNIKDSITHTAAQAKDKATLSANPSRDDEIIAAAATPVQRNTITETESTEDFTIQRTQQQGMVGDTQFVAQGETVFSKGGRPQFRDDATGHRPWNWEMANDSIRNSSDGMGIIEPVGPSAADFELLHANDQLNQNENQSQLKSQQNWEAVKSNTRQDLQNLKQAATTEASQNWNQAKSDLKQDWTEAKGQIKENWNEAKSDLKKNFEAAKDTVSDTWDQKKQNWQQNKEAAKENLRESTEAVRENWNDTKSVAKEGIREAGQQLKQGVQDIKEGVKHGWQAASTANAQPGMTKPQRVEQSYEELFNQPPGQRAQAAADRLVNKQAKDETRAEVEKNSSPEHDEKNAQVPKKEPTRYGDFESGSRATDF